MALSAQLVRTPLPAAVAAATTCNDPILQIQFLNQHVRQLESQLAESNAANAVMQQQHKENIQQQLQQQQHHHAQEIRTLRQELQQAAAAAMSSSAEAAAARAQAAEAEAKVCFASPVWTNRIGAKL
jgi:hypothetical protein